ncbi:hypothetical protein [Corynebacterium variabile]|uniref:Uncharacterized protein n=1 Tax=Corynebacterium variabile TaxID=1727 RepID=A0A4Y4C4N5_9CORY|nr:hypothetical protein [Corynebacterium variabile]GEC87106.1 hypothetical protein CVA01_24200 [Corynebacterium variabile]
MALATAEALDIAARILDTGKAIVPDRFPATRGEAGERTLAAWADVFADAGANYPPEVWAPAVRSWAARSVGERMVAPREILNAAREVVAVWEGDPEKAAFLDRHRNAYLSRREAAGALPVGTTPVNPPDARTAAISAHQGNGRARARAFMDELATRNLAALDDPDATPHDRARARKRAEERAQRRAARDARTTRNHPQIGA